MFGTEYQLHKRLPSTRGSRAPPLLPSATAGCRLLSFPRKQLPLNPGLLGCEFWSPFFPEAESPEGKGCVSSSFCQGLIGPHPQSLRMVTAAMELKDSCSLEEKL